MMIIKPLLATARAA